MEESKIVKYIVNEASIEESKEVLQWIESSPENKEEYEKLKQTWQKSAEIKEEYFDAESAWSTFRAKNLKPKTKIFKLHSAIKWSVAAVILLGLIFTLNPFSEPKVSTIAHTANLPTKEVQLSDGSIVTLVEGKITYNENFNKKNRPLKLEGKAYFKVASNQAKKFTVQAGECKIEVLGTEFEVIHDAGIVSVSVTEGKVAFNTPHGGKLLTKGDAATYSIKEDRLAEKEFVDNDLAYATRKLIFDKVSLYKAVEEIEELYDVKISLDEHIADKLISTRFDNESLENVLEVLRLTLNIKVENKNGKIELKGKEEDRL